MQQGMLFHALAAPGRGVDIEQIRIRFPCAVDVPAFQRAWIAVAQRHDILRTYFEWEGLPAPRQCVAAQIDVEVVCHAGASQETIETHVAADRKQGFDLRRAPAMRFALFNPASEQAELLWTFHHILLDGRSFPLVLEQVLATYSDEQATDALRLIESDRHREVPPFQQFVEWQQRLAPEPARDYWSDHLRDLLGAVPLPWSAAEDRAEEADAGTGKISSRLSAKTTAALTVIVESHALAWSALVEASWAALLWRHSENTDVTVGVVRAGRRDTVPGSQDMVGLFINTLPLRVQIDPERSLVEIARQVRQAGQQQRPHQHLGLNEIQRLGPEALHGKRLFETLVVYDHQILDAAMKARGAHSDMAFSYRGTTGYPLTLQVYGGECLVVELEYDPTQIDADTAQRLVERYQSLLTGLADSPQAPLRALPWLSADDMDAVLHRWNKTTVTWDDPAPNLAAAVLRTAQRVPDAPAIVFEGQSTTYSELAELIGGCARALRAQGVGSGDRVAISLARSPRMIAAALAVHQVGAAYVPCDPRYPADRLKRMLEDAEAGAAVADTAGRQRLGDFAGPVIDVGAVAASDAATPSDQAGQADTAVIIFTSGSTGRPKGVMLSHGNILNFLYSSARLLEVAPGDRFLGLTTLSFDLSLLDLYLPLTTGGIVVLASSEDAQDGARIDRLIRQQRVARVLATPMTYRMLLTANWQPPSGFVAVVGGDAVARAVVDDVRALGVRFYAICGPTEITVWSTFGELDDGPITIGRPVHNTRSYVVDAWGQPVAPGVPGEQWTGGAGVAQGYVARPELTAERFVDCSLDPNGRVCKTGDRVRWRSDGRLEFLERVDFQVKLRGFRVELGEVERVLERHSDVKQAVVLKRDDQLVGYVVGTPNLQANALRGWAGQHLPTYMVPAIVMVLDQFPLTANNKVNRQALPAPVVTPTHTGVAVPPQTPTEREVGEIWAGVLGGRHAGRQDNFFDVGGDSLRLVFVLGRLQARFDVDFVVADLFRLTTIEQIAGAIDLCQSGHVAGTDKALDDRAARRRRVLTQRRKPTGRG